jgi:dihydrofolate synthase / folylpolyglutamate synthase
MKIKSYEEALEKIFIKEQTNADYSLEKVKEWYKKLWEPLKNIQLIHIAGTNGKGSTSQMIFSVLKLDHKKVGVFSSPHLLDLRERFFTEKWKIEKEEFVDILNVILDLWCPLSFFELCTLIAFEFFRRKKVEYAIIEVGLWWLLDSTNIIDSIITAITSIAYDHMDFLWNTLEEISYQKAGIIKPWIPIVYNHKNEVIEKIAYEKWAPLIFAWEQETNLLGEYQKRNAGIAYEIAKYLGIEENIIKSWLMQVNHPWRLQYITKNLLIDGAHNEAGMQELKKYISSLADSFDEIVLCFALKKGKNPLIVTGIFVEKSSFIIVNSSDNSALENSHDIKTGLEKIWKSWTILPPEEIYTLSQKNKKTLYIVFWSLYMIGEFLKFM